MHLKATKTKLVIRRLLKTYLACGLAALAQLSLLTSKCMAGSPGTTEQSLPPAVVKYLDSMDPAKRAAASAWVEKMYHAATADDGDNLLATLRPRHPRLMLLESDIERVKENIKSDPIAAEMWKSIEQRAAQILAEPPWQNKVSETDQLELSRLVLKRVYTLAGAYRLSHDRRYFERARSEMLQAAALKSWDPPHFLDVAEMTNALAIGYDWLYDDLSRNDRKAIKEAIVQLGLNEGLKAYESFAWWTYAKNNWNPVCNGGLIAGALAVADEEPQLANRILRCARISLPRAMASFAPDGGWAEGPGYWSYCTRYVAYLCSDLKSALGAENLAAADLDFTRAPGLSHTGYFRIYFCGPLGKSFNFADATEEVNKAWQCMWLSRTFNNRIFAGQELLLARDNPDIFHLLFYSPGDAAVTAKSEKLDLNTCFKGVDVAFFRSSWTDPNALFVGFKGGDNRANHSHLDLGTFVYDFNGYRWALDLGPDNYHLPGYFGKERYNYYRLKTEGHNCLTVDNQNQIPTAQAKMIACPKNEKSTFAGIDLEDAYRGQLTGCNRALFVFDNRMVTIADDLKARHAVPITWHWHTRAKVRLSEDGRHATLEQSGAYGSKSLYMYIALPKNAKFSIKPSAGQPPQDQQPDVTDLCIDLTMPKGRTKIEVRALCEPTTTAPAVASGPSPEKAK